MEKWQNQWDRMVKARTTKEFFPNIKERLKNKSNITSNFTAFVTAHSKTKAYLHHFRIMESPGVPLRWRRPNSRPPPL
jgi:hypothetical protein